MRDDNCIFCKIANGEIPSATLYEDEEFRVILDLGPASKGHALILPKEHYRNLYDIDEEVVAKAMILAKKMVNKLTKVLDCDGYNIVQNNEEYYIRRNQELLNNIIKGIKSVLVGRWESCRKKIKKKFWIK